ncbi:DNA repair protein RecN [Leptothermofonsia sichuanensis E412]|uniref:DNA repair protein RecN n=1 Tax=Leptothermofonsia sichuanensis TaxID=2917832 RepID=UPI001CA69695|nr:DNA repair protein RecN [Leptothermofonsia sichuanensis]QZZ18948.1 DNA repair protein RecN [Leptothermofonsia sichuanensis E412]
MLLSLRIENFALVDHLELQLGAGLTVLTGETGAGKSIILDAIDAVLGGKVTSRAVRTGAERALLEATFQMDGELAAWLVAHEIEVAEPSALICSREITLNQGSQRSRSRVNGVVVNRQQMEDLRDRLVEITAQGQTVQIGQPSLQREWLDSYGGDPLLQQRERVATAWTAYQQASQALDRRRQSEQERLQQLDLFEYQLRELHTANLEDPDELDQLEQERNRLTHSVELQQKSYQVYQALYENDGDVEACADLLGRSEETLRSMVEYDSQLQPILELVNNALALVEQAGREINFYGESIEADPQRLQAVQERIVELKQICRKYGPTLADAIARQQRLQVDLDTLTDGGQSLEELEQSCEQRYAELTAACAQLTHLRQSTAKDLEERLVKELKPLAMEKVKFQVQITPCPPSALGADQITFLFSPNPGEPLQPLTEIASGGEMSRFLLALQASFTQIDPVGTLVFDEIDVGVSGRVAQAIAEKLHQLSHRHQVLCVTHQPIVAAMADHHLRVNKEIIGDSPPSTNGRRPQGTGKRKSQNIEKSDPATPLSPLPSDVRTVVRITPLSNQQRREELAQLAGGDSVQEAIAFADSLLTQAANLRQTHPIDLAQPSEPPSESITKAKPRSRTSHLNKHRDKV